MAMDNEEIIQGVSDAIRNGQRAVKAYESGQLNQEIMEKFNKINLTHLHEYHTLDVHAAMIEIAQIMTEHLRDFMDHPSDFCKGVMAGILIGLKLGED